MTASTTTATTFPGTARRTILKRPRLSKHKAKSLPTTQPLLLSNLRVHYGTRRRPSSNSTTSRDKTAAATATIGEGHNCGGSATKVRFAPKVRVKRVPSRHSYAVDSKAMLWFTRKQLSDLVHKNLAEVQVEPDDWRAAPEEDDFVTTAKGNRVHPLYATTVADEEEEDDASDGSDDDSSLSTPP